MNIILCFLCFSLFGWICLFVGLKSTNRFRAETALETSQAEDIIQGYEVKERP